MLIDKGENRSTNGMQSLYVVNAIEFVGSRWFAVIHLINRFKAILLQIRSICEKADDPGERVAEIYASSNYKPAVIKQSNATKRQSLGDVLPV